MPSPIPLSDEARFNWVQTVDELFADWRRTRLPIHDYVRSHRAEIDRTINGIVHGHMARLVMH